MDLQIETFRKRIEAIYEQKQENILADGEENIYYLAILETLNEKPLVFFHVEEVIKNGPSERTVTLPPEQVRENLLEKWFKINQIASRREIKNYTHLEKNDAAMRLAIVNKTSPGTDPATSIYVQDFVLIGNCLERRTDTVYDRVDKWTGKIGGSEQQEELFIPLSEDTNPTEPLPPVLSFDPCNLRGSPFLIYAVCDREDGEELSLSRVYDHLNALQSDPTKYPKLCEHALSTPTGIAREVGDSTYLVPLPYKRGLSVGDVPVVVYRNEVHYVEKFEIILAVGEKGLYAADVTQLVKEKEKGDIPVHWTLVFETALANTIKIKIDSFRIQGDQLHFDLVTFKLIWLQWIPEEEFSVSLEKAVTERDVPTLDIKSTLTPNIVETILQNGGTGCTKVIFSREPIG